MLKLIHLPIHHIGIAVLEPTFTKFAENRDFNIDEKQGVKTIFEWNNTFDCYIEYFTISGRAKNYKPGFNHICYQLESRVEFHELMDFWKNTNLGVQVTEIERSGSKECNFVVFCFLSGLGMVEFNIND